MSEARPPILLCVTFAKAHAKHLPDLMEWYALNKQRHNLYLFWVPWRPLHKAQGDAVQQAINIGASHILFTEHDQWGYPIDGLQLLLHHDKDVVGFMTHYKNPPFLPMCYQKVDPEISMLARTKNLKPFHPNGLQKCDMVTWGFTLVKMSVFKRMSEAAAKEREIVLSLLEDVPEIKTRLGERRAREIFTQAANDAMEPFCQWGTVPTDSRFCQLCEDLGIERWVDGTYIIEHGDIPNEQVPFHRRAHGTYLAAKTHLKVNDVIADEQDHGTFFYRTEQQMEFEQARKQVAG